MFTRNQRQWTPAPLKPEHVTEFRAEAKTAGYLTTAVSHASYLINLCAQNPESLAKSKIAFQDEIERCAELGIPYLCIHPGSHVGAGEDAGLAAIAVSVREALAATKGKKVTILLENTAGQGTNLGWRLEHLETLLRLTRSKRVGVCIDTCHLFAAGYDLKSAPAYDKTMQELDDRIGFDRIHAFHLNDSKHPVGSKRDRHEHIGEGEIGKAAFRRLVNDARVQGKPGLLETPGGPDGYKDNLKRLRSMRRK